MGVVREALSIGTELISYGAEFQRELTISLFSKSLENLQSLSNQIISYLKQKEDKIKEYDKLTGLKTLEYLNLLNKIEPKILDDYFNISILMDLISYNLYIMASRILSTQISVEDIIVYKEEAIIRSVLEKEEEDYLFTLYCYITETSNSAIEEAKKKFGIDMGAYPILIRTTLLLIGLYEEDWLDILKENYMNLLKTQEKQDKPHFYTDGGKPLGSIGKEEIVLRGYKIVEKNTIEMEKLKGKDKLCRFKLWKNKLRL